MVAAQATYALAQRLITLIFLPAQDGNSERHLRWGGNTIEGVVNMSSTSTSIYAPEGRSFLVVRAGQGAKRTGCSPIAKKYSLVQKGREEELSIVEILRSAVLG